MLCIYLYFVAIFLMINFIYILQGYSMVLGSASDTTLKNIGEYTT